MQHEENYIDNIILEQNFVFVKLVQVCGVCVCGGMYAWYVCVYAFVCMVYVCSYIMMCVYRGILCEVVCACACMWGYVHAGRRENTAPLSIPFLLYPPLSLPILFLWSRVSLWTWDSHCVFSARLEASKPPQMLLSPPASVKISQVGPGHLTCHMSAGLIMLSSKGFSSLSYLQSLTRKGVAICKVPH